MRRLALSSKKSRLAAALAATLAIAGCSRGRKADPEQGFHPGDPAAGGPGADDPRGLAPPPAVGPGALAAQPQGGMAPAQGDMPNDDVHAGVAARNAAGSNPHAGGSGGDMGSMGFQSPDPNAPVDPNKYLRGVIHPSDATKARIPANALIYISVKKVDPTTGEAAAGMPIATDRLSAASWPLSFELTQRNLMVAGGDFSGDIVVTARYAQNSDPLMKAPGDVTGHVRATIPADKLDITLDTVLP